MPLISPLMPVPQLLHFHTKNQNRLMKGTGVKRRDVCPGSSMSTEVAPAKSTHMLSLQCSTLLVGRQEGYPACK